MEQIIGTIWPILVSTALGAVTVYAGFIHSLRIKVAVLEQRVDNLQKRVDSHSKKTDEILDAISEFKMDVSKELSKIAVDIAKINTTLNIAEEKSEHKKR